MASGWAANLSRVKVRRADTPKRVTFVYPYYDCPKFFDYQVGVWSQYPEDLKALVSAIIVDDGSPTPAVLPSTQPFPMRVFRIQIDIPWNWLAARNIGAHHAPNGWILFTDMDHVVPVETLRHLLWGQHDERVVYGFSRREHSGGAIAPHSASFLMTRALFWEIGGYDESLSGHYGTDGEFRRRIVTHAPIHIVTDELVRHEYVADACTDRYPRKHPDDVAAVPRLVKARPTNWVPKVLSFPYEEISCSP